MKPVATIKLGRALGIDILIHWSFFLLPLVVVWLSIWQGDSVSVTALWLVTLVVILASVLIHELGHGVAAQWLGIPIVDIILTPICGLARLQHPPKRPVDEVVVAIAGPISNLVVAALAGAVVWASGAEFSWRPDMIRSSLLLTLFWVNAALFALNLLPIFPMDGGRVLRAILAMSIEGGKATVIAARLGQLFSIGGVAVGLVWNFPPLVIIGVFLLLTADQEIRNHRAEQRIN